ncbi:MAG: 6-carboxytetrahydropterin synthase [Bacteroidales bacterium]|nr:6-carboxytetrahydropterin synthase [Bacteroidales bacterium]
MPRIRITKEFSFEMAHALMGYDGPCRNIHGHSYSLQVTVIGNPIDETNHPKLGMVMDFSDLKRIVKQTVVDVFDHALVLNKAMKPLMNDSIIYQFSHVIFLDYQPTSELMVADFASRISNELPSELKLYRVLLRETATSFAEWYAADNEGSGTK